MRKGTDSNSAAKHALATIGAAHLLHPAMHFDHPRDVLMANNISKDEKRAILASWASDICAIESMPAWRCFPGTQRIVAYDDVLAALKALDGDDQSTSAQKPMALFDYSKSPRRRPQAHRSGGGFGLCSYWKGGRRKQPFEI
ncbi:hypothetical protein HFO89_36660 [Rhizobium leguminosarum]|jgi:hypothetical protein|uniref:hypothetical protein n=1 Tax=Rhizobium leguminosarum TaxID=384 RepID=UPI001C948E15|nr:hypothetical protein [Rhizobium leguminosarum]MBY5461767.1 hypothetical protein [Rhizobium leguminosarum]